MIFLRTLKVDPLNRVIAVNSHLDETHIDRNMSFSVFIAMLKCVENGNSIAHPMLIVIERYIIWRM